MIIALDVWRDQGDRGGRDAVWSGALIFSILHLVFTIRALLRSLSERFVFGIVGGFLRAGLMLVGAVIGFKQAAIVMLPHMTLRLSPSDESDPSLGLSLGLLFVSVVGPIVTFSVLWTSYRRSQNVPVAQEEKLQRPFRAWLPVGIIDAIYVVITVGAIWISER